MFRYSWRSGKSYEKEKEKNYISPHAHTYVKRSYSFSFITSEK